MHKFKIFIFLALLGSMLSVNADNSKEIEKFNNLFDKNSDGSITLEEFSAVRKKWNAEKFTDELNTKSFNFKDKNKDGVISLEEFLPAK